MSAKEYWKDYSNQKLAELARNYVNELLSRGVQIKIDEDDSGSPCVVFTVTREI